MSESSQFRRVLELRKGQGWSETYVQGESALILSLLQAGMSPEDIAGATLHKDWSSRVAKFAGSSDFLKVMGVDVENAKTSRTWWRRLFSRPER